MRVATCILTSLLSVGYAHGQSAEVCPKLPADAQLQWSYTKGPDFDVCQAMRGKQQIFGVYLGNHPSFRPVEGLRAEKGKIGKHDVTWYNVPSTDASRPISKQTLLTLSQRPDAQVAHVWVLGANANELNQGLAILQRVQFK